MAATVSQRIQEHAVWTDLDDLDTIVADAAKLLDEADADASSSYASLVALTKYARTRLKSINPLLVPEALLNSADRAINAIYNAVNEAVDQEDATRLPQAWTLATDLLNAVAVLPVVVSRRDTTAMTEAMSEFHLRIIGLLDAIQTRSGELSNEFENLDARCGELASEISGQKGLLAEAIREHAEQFEAGQTSRSETFTEALNAAKTALDEANEQATKFYNEDEERHVKQIAEFQTQFDAVKELFETTSKEAHDAHTAQADELIARLQAELEQGKRLVEMIGEVTMTGHYQKNAKEQKQIADKWRLATVGVGAAAVISAIVVAVTSVIYRDVLDVTDIITHAGVTIALTALATFLGAQSHSHRRREEDYRALELELATLDPFLSSLDDQERQRIKAELALRYFKGVNRDGVTLDEVAG